MQSEVVHRAATAIAHDPAGVGVIHHHHGAVFFRQLHDLGKGGQVAIHGEHAVGDHQFPAGQRLNLGQNVFQRPGVLVGINPDLRARQPAAVDDAGMVELVRDDQVSLAQNRRHRAGVGGKARLKDHAGLHLLEPGNLFFELHVHPHGPGDGSDRARPHAELPQGSSRGFDETGMGVQSQVVVGGKVHHGPSIELSLWQLLSFQNLESPVELPVLQALQLSSQKPIQKSRHADFFTSKASNSG